MEGFIHPVDLIPPERSIRVLVATTRVPVASTLGPTGSMEITVVAAITTLAHLMAVITGVTINATATITGTHIITTMAAFIRGTTIRSIQDSELA